MEEKREDSFGFSDKDDAEKGERKVSIRIVIDGKVQGVGYRNWLRKKALDRQVHGWVRNRNDGHVEALLNGGETAVKEIIGLCYQGPPAAAVRAVKEFPETNVRSNSQGFVLLPTM